MVGRLILWDWKKDKMKQQRIEKLPVSGVEKVNFITCFPLLVCLAGIAHFLQAQSAPPEPTGVWEPISRREVFVRVVKQSDTSVSNTQPTMGISSVSSTQKAYTVDGKGKKDRMIMLDQLIKRKLDYFAVCCHPVAKFITFHQWQHTTGFNCRPGKTEEKA